MIDSGIYQLLIYLPRQISIKIGNLGRIVFKPGYYIYTGSARKNLRHRLARHLSDTKLFHWHIDYLLEYAEIVSYNYEKYDSTAECRTNLLTKQKLIDSQFIPGFGCSDCRCQSHLIYLPKNSPGPEVCV